MLRANRKAREGINHPARDAQFGCINDRVKEALAVAEPAILVNSKFSRVNLNGFRIFPIAPTVDKLPHVCASPILL
ncbi:ISAzo13-like element transposase-related protein [Rhizobium gallicum]|uniref:ISAzo13-like element transposase-related protein n=1 Tax=Rhizobium gallicum TaxID=56730 RepID=UPI003B8A5EA2